MAYLRHPRQVISKVGFITKLKDIRFFVLILMILILLLTLLSSCSKEPDKYEIWMVTKNYIESNLENPLEVRFPSQYEEFIYEVEKDKYEVKAYLIEGYSRVCCHSLKFFSCTVDYKNGAYIPHSLKFYGERLEESMD